MTMLMRHEIEQGVPQGWRGAHQAADGAQRLRVPNSTQKWL